MAEDKRPAQGNPSGDFDISELDDVEYLGKWYESVSKTNTRDAGTIGILGGRSVDAGPYRITRAKKAARLREILRIASHYDVLHGLTPVTLRKLLEELGPTFVKAGQILSMRSEILPQSFCDELTKLRTDVEPMDREEVLSTLRAEYDTP